MENAQIISTDTVQATSIKESTNKIELASSDLSFLTFGAIQKGLLFPKPNPDQPLLVQHLKKSLSQTLDLFFPLSGRLSSVEHDDGSISFFIDCNNTGAEFIRARAEKVTISDVLDPIYVPSIVHSFFPLNGIKSYEGISKPLLGAQVTELVDGIFIGLTMNHSVVDGTTFWNFINCWSQISRDHHNQISKLPVFEHWFRRDNHCQVRLPFPLSSIISEEKEKNLSNMEERVFHFSKETIARLKAKANDEAGSTMIISSLQSILAHIWHAVIRNRKIIDPNQESNFFMLIGLRSRLKPAIPEEYFGNAVQIGTVTLKSIEVKEKGLGYVASQINKMIASFTEEKVRLNLESWKENIKTLTMRGLVKESDLGVSSSPRFNIYGNDFGWGRPITVRSGPGNKSCGKLTVFSGVEEGSIDVEVSVFTEDLEAMGKDSQFMDAFRI